MAFTLNSDLLAIKAELTVDSLELGLTILPEDDEANANALNLVRPTLLVDRNNIPSQQIRKCINRVNWNAATAADRTWIELQLAADLIDTTPGEIRTGFLAIFGAGTVTRILLEALLTETSNRIEHLFRSGALSKGGFVTPSDVANARAAT